jgi:hypothetical protein
MALDLLNKALDDDKNENLLNLTTKKINQINLNMLSKLHLDKNTTLDYFKKLRGYRYIDEVDGIKYGSFIRWIPLTDPNYLPLHFCGIICDIKITDNGVNIVCKNFMHRHYQIKMDECLIFQKLSNQELILLQALDHLEKEQDIKINNIHENSIDEETEDENTIDEEILEDNYNIENEDY